MNTQENKNVENTPSANTSESFEESCKQTALQSRIWRKIPQTQQMTVQKI